MKMSRSNDTTAPVFTITIHDVIGGNGEGSGNLPISTFLIESWPIKSIAAADVIRHDGDAGAMTPTVIVMRSGGPTLAESVGLGGVTGPGTGTSTPSTPAP